MIDPSTQGIKTVLHPVSDVATAKAVYAALLGAEPQTDESYYVGFEAEGQHIGLVPNGGPRWQPAGIAAGRMSADVRSRTRRAQVSQRRYA